MASSNAGTKGVPRADRELQILDIAAEEFARCGYARASIADIARRAGISKPLIYVYFESKDGLYLACLRRAGDALVQSVAAAQKSVTALRALDTLEAIFTALEPRRHDWLILNDHSLPAESVVREEARRYRRALSDLGATGTAEVLATAGSADLLDRSLTLHLWLNTVTSAVQWWLDHPDESASAMTARCTRILGALVAAEELGTSTRTKDR
ncbi:TetR/AcrR family transcriptional regulator [Antrihabitans cavernicola]|uniref:TetR/AcrR family transcriptional regulator n=1 Tax=Antrihabitans cavernicola TaxID=2495913 RepID=A0A5A7SG12_9NOCA|nr:TetR/AcrR family transcriptional regulator [Spelaeibacter cavernicola]KAA0024514.1 TetR/AcrR family transcriptional regulator [Spelaeibacter cavernicola]